MIKEVSCPKAYIFSENFDLNMSKFQVWNEKSWNYEPIYLKNEIKLENFDISKTKFWYLQQKKNIRLTMITLP